MNDVFDAEVKFKKMCSSFSALNTKYHRHCQFLNGKVISTPGVTTSTTQ